MEYYEIDEIFCIINIFNLSDEDKIEYLKQKYDIDEILKETNDIEYYQDPLVRYRLTIIRDRLNLWIECGLITKRTR